MVCHRTVPQKLTKRIRKRLPSLLENTLNFLTNLPVNVAVECIQRDVFIHLEIQFNRKVGRFSRRESLESSTEKSRFAGLPRRENDDIAALFHTTDKIRQLQKNGRHTSEAEISASATFLPFADALAEKNIILDLLRASSTSRTTLSPGTTGVLNRQRSRPMR